MSALVLGAVILMPVSVTAQQAARPLPPPDATFEEPFSSVGVGTVREMRDGRVMVADARDKVVQIVDFRTGSMQAVGREGSGPGEFGLPMRVWVGPGDSTFLYDPLNSRYLTIAPDGKPAGLFRVELAPTEGPGGMMVGGITMARWVDARGRLYMETPGVRVGPNGPESADSSAIVRYDRATQKLDTLGMVKLQKSNLQVSGGQGNMRMTMMGSGNPLNPRDEWTVFPDGRVAIVRSEPYRVDWVMPDGTKRSSTPIRHTPLRITEADKKEEEALRLRARANQMMVTMSMGPGGTQRSSTMGPAAGAPPPPPLTDWPDVKPPFRAGMASVLARPTGELWVRKLEPAGAKGTLYDVINAQGAVTHQVRIPEGFTLVGFGNGTVYTTKLDEDDLVYLQRHRVPETPVRG